MRQRAASGIATGQVQRDHARPTGRARVHVGDDGQAAFAIKADAAWDSFEWTDAWADLAASADAVCFGSLAQRAPASRQTIQMFLRAASPDALRLFDVNLRSPFYDADVISQSLELANVVKLNHDELPRVAELLRLGGRGENAWAHRLIQVFDLDLVCVTRGARGSLLVSPTELTEHPGVPARVVDTVGAGDAFTACLAHGYLRGATLDDINNAANRAGAWVAAHHGATPPAPPGGLPSIINRPIDPELER